MNYVIINPIWIYMFEIVYNILGILVLVVIISGVVCVIYIFLYYEGYRETKYRKRYQMCLKIIIVILVIFILVPSKEALITMIVAKNTTYSSINNIKDILLEIIKQIKEIIG